MTPSERTIICFDAEVNVMKIGPAVTVLWLFKDSRCPSEKSVKTGRIGVNLDKVAENALELPFYRELDCITGLLLFS